MRVSVVEQNDFVQYLEQKGIPQKWLNIIPIH